MSQEPDSGPPTLRPDDSFPGPYAPRPDGSLRTPIASKDEGKSAVRAAQDDYDTAVATAPYPIGISNGVPARWVTTKTSSGSSAAAAALGWGDPGGGESDPNSAASGHWEPLSPSDPVMQEWATLQQVKKDVGYFLEDVGSGAGRSYLSTETDKQQEVTRQFKDFLARAEGTYDLMGKERAFAMAGDDQTAENNEAVQKGYLNAAWATPYADTRGPGLGSILGRSMPDYVLPDYRLNSAVGLPGAEGFDMPGYANGTGFEIPPDLAPLLGKPVIVPPDPLPPTGRKWPWGGGVAR